MKSTTTGAKRGLKRSAPDDPSSADDNDAHDAEQRRLLFGNMPEAKRRKFILVDDPERGGARIRVRVMLDQVKMDDMPDAHLRLNAVFPRSYFPRQMGAASTAPTSRSTPAVAVSSSWDDDYNDDRARDPDEESALADRDEDDASSPRTWVPVPLLDGSEAHLPVPRMTASRRRREVALNELGYRMSWVQARTFSGMSFPR